MSIKGLIGYMVLNDIENVTHALKLQELVKERIKGAPKSGHKKFSDEVGYLEQELQSLLEESEK